jgi:hypothetical protein
MDDKDQGKGNEHEHKPEPEFVPPQAARFTPPRESSFAPPVIASKKHSRKNLFYILGLVVLLTVAGLLAYLWYSEKDRADQLDQQVGSLVEQKRASSETEDKTEAPASASYKAEVGKFTLTLADKYYIIVEHDGGFEGGPITQLKVATKGDKGTQTLTAPSHQSVTISAVPIGESPYEDRVAAGLSEFEESERSQLTAVKVDGANAEVWRLSGLFNDKKLFFEKNGVFYTITAGNAGSDEGPAQAVLTDVLKGFKFDS